jgi:hypothetical protein
MSTLYEKWNLDDQSFTAELALSTGSPQYHTFTAATTHVITSFKMLMDVTGDYGGTGLIGYLYNVTAGAPTTEIMASALVPYSSTGNNQWIEFTLTSGVELTEGTVYALLVSGAFASSKSLVQIKANNSGAYSGGNWGYSTTGGATWIPLASVDGGFEVWGSEGGGGGGETVVPKLQYYYNQARV